MLGVNVVELKVFDLGELIAAVQKRKHLAAVAVDKPAVGGFVELGAAVLHTVLFGVALDLSVSEHR